MEKYNLLPAQLLYEGTIKKESLFTPGTVEENLVLQIHTQEYWKKLSTLSLSSKEERKTGFPLSHSLVEREKFIMQGTVEAAFHALEIGIAFNIAGGTHHAFSDRGEGFCLLNDIALGAQALLNAGKAKKILVIDLDVHQGNGTAEIFRHRPEVFTFSMHGQANYPLHKEESDLDIGLETGITDDKYLPLLEDTLQKLFAEVKPDFVFYQSGVDVIFSDKLGHLKLSLDGCRRRDALVWNFCTRNNVPAMACMGGGYSSSMAHIIEAHANTYREAAKLL